MSTLYQDLDLTNFPNDIDQRYIMVDPSTDKDMALINQFNSLMRDNKIDEALEVINKNPTLKQMCFNAEKYNRHEDQIIAIQRFWQSNIQQYLVDLVVNRGKYSSTATYQKYNVVFYEKDNVTQAYMAIQNNIPAGSSPTTNYFVPVTLRGEKGETGTGLAWRGIYDANEKYYSGDCVSYEGRLWVFVYKEGRIGKTPMQYKDGDIRYWDAAFVPDLFISAEQVKEDALRRFLKIGNGNDNRILVADNNGDAIAGSIRADSLWHKGNMSYGSSDPSGGNNGDIYFKIVG